MDYYYDNSYLAHHGIKGMKWGVRKYQNDDGSLTAAGRARYGMGNVKVGKSNMTLKPTSFGQMKRDVRKRNRKMIKDTIKSTFSKDNGLRVRDFAGLGPTPHLYYAASKFNKQGLKDSMARNKQIMSESKKYLQDTYGDKYTYAKNRQRVRAMRSPVGAAAMGASYAVKKIKNKKLNG